MSRSVIVSLQAGHGSENGAAAAAETAASMAFSGSLFESGSAFWRRWAGVPNSVSTISFSSLCLSESSEAIRTNINMPPSSNAAMVRTMIVAPTSNQVNKGSARCAAQPTIIVKIVTSPVHLIAGFQPFAAKPHDEYGSNRDENTPWLIDEIADIEANQ